MAAVPRTLRTLVLTTAALLWFVPGLPRAQGAAQPAAAAASAGISGKRLCASAELVCWPLGGDR